MNRRSILRGLAAGMVLGFVQAFPGLSRVPVKPERPLLPFTDDGKWAIIRETHFNSPEACLEALRATGRRPIAIRTIGKNVTLVMSPTETWRIIPVDQFLWPVRVLSFKSGPA